jgi:hypothetical protein
VQERLYQTDQLASQGLSTNIHKVLSPEEYCKAGTVIAHRWVVGGLESMAGILMLSEDEIQIQIVEWLTLMGIVCFHIPNERSSSVANMMKLKRLGLLPGAADLEVWVPINGKIKIVYMEVKRYDGRQSVNQKAFQAMCEKAGHPYHVVRSLDEAIEVVRMHQKQGV